MNIKFAKLRISRPKKYFPAWKMQFGLSVFGLILHYKVGFYFVLEYLQIDFAPPNAI
jgi:hypothetical protein